VVSLGLLLSSLDSSGFSLFLELGLSDFLLLHLVDGFDQNGFVLELVTLGAEIEMMVDILGDLLGLSVLLEKSSEDSLSSHPEDLRRHSCVSGTLSLTETVVSSLSLGLLHSLASRSRVHMDLSLHDKTIVKEFLDVLSGVGESDFVCFIWVDPNSSLSTLQHSSSQSFLESQKCHKSIFF